MTHDSNPLGYRSKPDAVSDDARRMHRSLRTWALLWAVWVVGLAVWALYLALFAYLVYQVFG